jgi:hypothetical protein
MAEQLLPGLQPGTLGRVWAAVLGRVESVDESSSVDRVCRLNQCGRRCDCRGGGEEGKASRRRGPKRCMTSPAAVRHGQDDQLPDSATTSHGPRRTAARCEWRAADITQDCRGFRQPPMASKLTSTRLSVCIAQTASLNRANILTAPCPHAHHRRVSSLRPNYRTHRAPHSAQVNALQTD